jgi:hypothetical protein
VKNIEISEAPIASVSELGMVPIAFTVDRVCDVLAPRHGLVGWVPAERFIETPYVKNYCGAVQQNLARASSASRYRNLRPRQQQMLVIQRRTDQGRSGYGAAM